MFFVVLLDQFESIESFVLLSKLCLEMVTYVAFHIGMLGNEEDDLLKQANPLLISLFEAVVVLHDDNDQASYAISLWHFPW